LRSKVKFWFHYNKVVVDLIKHCNSVPTVFKSWPSKANKIIGFLRRNLPIKNTEAKTLAYKSMVRSNLEYCANIWSPHTEKLKSKLEQVQRRAARYVI
jgi:hypothetical protein